MLFLTVFFKVKEFNITFLHDCTWRKVILKLKTTFPLIILHKVHGLSIIETVGREEMITDIIHGACQPCVITEKRK
jgi:hypothetical protein